MKWSRTLMSTIVSLEGLAELPFLSEEDKDWVMGRAIPVRLQGLVRLRPLLRLDSNRLDQWPVSALAAS